jgi:hypothetical protein
VLFETITPESSYIPDHTMATARTGHPEKAHPPGVFNRMTRHRAVAMERLFKVIRWTFGVKALRVLPF